MDVPMTQARNRFGTLIRRAGAGHERITITDHGQPAAVLISPAELADLEDSAALAEYRGRQASGSAEPSMPHDEVRRQLGLPAAE